MLKPKNRYFVLFFKPLNNIFNNKNKLFIIQK